MGERSPYKAEVTGSKPVPPMWQRWGGSSARLERLPVTQEAAGSSPVHPVNKKLLTPTYCKQIVIKVDLSN